MEESRNIFKIWGEKIDWNKRVTQVCKPCWELKYCPYGPLVENFPIREEPDEKSCRIFGHDCPVFYVNEPLTETRELRNISRTIPRIIQFKVLKRENQICRNCGKSVLDEDIHFDHIIPYSKGGATEDYNIRLLCSTCNRKRSNNFEEEFLVKDFHELMSDPYDVDIVDFFIMAINFGHEFKAENGEAPTAQDYANEFTEGEVSVFENHVVNIYSQMEAFFTSRKPSELSQNEFEFLKERWGFETLEMYYIKDIYKDFEISIERAVEVEKSLFRRIGIKVKDNKSDLKKWQKY